MSVKGEAPRPAGRLEIIRLSEYEWRVGDRLADENSASKVIGFLEKRDGRFESTRIVDGCDLREFETFEGALAFLAAPVTGERSESR